MAFFSLCVSVFSSYCKDHPNNLILTQLHIKTLFPNNITFTELRLQCVFEKHSPTRNTQQTHRLPVSELQAGCMEKTCTRTVHPREKGRGSLSALCPPISCLPLVQVHSFRGIKSSAFLDCVIQPYWQETKPCSLVSELSLGRRVEKGARRSGPVAGEPQAGKRQGLASGVCQPQAGASGRARDRWCAVGQVLRSVSPYH